MGMFNSFIISFCTASILLGFLYMLCPSGNMNASVKFIFCLCFVCCTMGSVVSIPSPNFSFFDNQQKIEILTEQNTATVAQSIFCEALRRDNINFRKIVVDTNKLADGSIVISKITVYTHESPQRVIDVLHSDGYEVVVINE